MVLDNPGIPRIKISRPCSFESTMSQFSELEELEAILATQDLWGAYEETDVSKYLGDKRDKGELF